jgi:hypothetical protein
MEKKLDLVEVDDEKKKLDGVQVDELKEVVW